MAWLNPPNRVNIQPKTHIISGGEPARLRRYRHRRMYHRHQHHHRRTRRRRRRRSLTLDD